MFECRCWLIRFPRRCVFFLRKRYIYIIRFSSSDTGNDLWCCGVSTEPNSARRTKETITNKRTNERTDRNGTERNGTEHYGTRPRLISYWQLRPVCMCCIAISVCNVLHSETCCGERRQTAKKRERGREREPRRWRGFFESQESERSICCLAGNYCDETFLLVCNKNMLYAVRE